MPPSQEQPIAAPKQGIKWNEVTWYSKLAAIVVLLGMVPTLCFYIGAQYELTKKVFISPVSSQNSVTSTPSPLFQWVSLSTLTDKSRWFEENGKVYFKRYFNKILLPTANSQTFVVAVNQEGSSTLYAKDATTVYDGDTIFNNVDLGSFTPIFFNQEATSLSKDKSHVYDWAGGVISDVDPISVVAIGIVGGYPDGAEDEYFRYTKF